ncbi:MAG: erythromycin biosynthesis sensory transduction protein eryC1 [Phycisphaeraceae bacterium]|nr:erythromycin biosynthesis sensory transduction protein eryC1 [Phycisphaeraceae bacterium]
MIPPTDPKAAYFAHKDEIDRAVTETLDSGWYILGRQVESFEREFANYVGDAHAVGVASGTDAIELALRACGIGPGDVVLTVSHTAAATVAAIERCGASAYLVDIDPVTFTMDPRRLDEALGSGASGIRAVVPVHLYGHPADMPAIMDVARRRELLVVEDCAQAHGARLDGRRVGTWGDAAAFSFYPTKNLGALGDGGAVVTKDDALAERLKALREYGWTQRYVSTEAGINSRLDEIQAAVLRVRLRHLDDENGRRREIAARYDEALEAASVTRPVVRAGAEHVFHQYVVRAEDRDELRRHLSDHDIGTQIHYPKAIHQQPAYAALPQGTLADTNDAVARVLSLPMHPHLTDEQVATVARCIAEWRQRVEV